MTALTGARSCSKYACTCYLSLRLRTAFFGFGLLLGILELLQNLSLVTSGVVVVCVLFSLLLGALFSRVAGVHGLLLVEVVVLILVEVGLGHDGDEP
jgi:uncharacterized membrane protein YccC